MYNTINRLIKSFFANYRQPPASYANTQGQAVSSTGKGLKTLKLSKNQLQLKKKQIQKTKKQSRVLTPALYSVKFKLAQQKLIDQVRANFQKIKECKEQKTQIAECIFKYTES